MEDGRLAMAGGRRGISYSEREGDNRGGEKGSRRGREEVAVVEQERVTIEEGRRAAVEDGRRAAAEHEACDDNKSDAGHILDHLGLYLGKKQMLYLV